MTYAAFRSSDKFYRSRPAANCQAARLAWDLMSKDGELVFMRLLDGIWWAERSDGSTDDVEACYVKGKLADAELDTYERRMNRFAAKIKSESS